LGARGATRWTVLSTGVVSACFLLIATAMNIVVIDSIRRQGMDWIGVVLASLLNLVTLWLVIKFFRALLLQTAVGPTELEISDLPLVAGEKVSVFLLQPARLRIRLLDVVLECEEQATFRQGTDVRTENRIVYSQRLFRKRGIDVDHLHPFQTAFDFTLPAGAMHSFRSANNGIQWRIHYECEVKGWTPLRRVFSLIVVPPSYRRLAA
jgi:hypothetical protein